MASKANSRARSLAEQGIVGIGGMRHEWAKIILRHKVTQGRHIIHIKVFRLAAARIARKERKGVGANG